MAMEITTLENDERFDPTLMEDIVLSLADMFEVRITWNSDTAVLSGVGALVGGLVGGYLGCKLGAAVGVGLGTVTGFGVSQMVTLREVWTFVKEQLKELLHIVFNFLRRLDPIDYVRSFEIFVDTRASKTELCKRMVEFIATKLGREVISCA